MWEENSSEPESIGDDPFDLGEVDGFGVSSPDDKQEDGDDVVRLDDSNGDAEICDHAEHKETFPAQQWAEANAMGVGAGVGDYDIVTVCHKCDGIWLRNIGEDSGNNRGSLF